MRRPRTSTWSEAWGAIRTSPARAATTTATRASSPTSAWSPTRSPGADGTLRWDEIEAVWSESRKALRAGGGKGEYFLGKFPIGSLVQDWATVGFVDDLIRTYSIDTVISHHHGEAHQDHIAAQRIATAAARRHVDRLWLWESVIYTHRNVHPFNP